MRFSTRANFGAKKTTASFRPQVESLEDRLAPAGLSPLISPAAGPQFEPVAVQLPTGGNPPPILSYNGGTLLSHVEVQGIYFQDAVTHALQSQLDGFLTTLATSKWTIEMLHDFSAGGYNIGAGSFLGDDNTGLVVPPTSLLDDSQIQAMLSKQLATHHLATPDGNTLYFVFAPAGVEVTVDGYNSADSFLGYHNSFVDPATGKTLYYAVIPYQGAAPNGATGPDGPNANLGAEVQYFLGGSPSLTELQNITGVSSHEFSEAVTDPGVGNNGDLGWSVTNPSSVAPGYENGDLANAELATYHGYVVQEEWGRNASDSLGQATGPEVVPSDADFYVSQVNNPTAGAYNGVFATFTDLDGASEAASSFTVAISWGGGAISRTDDPATAGDISIVNNGDGTFNIVGQHVYSDPAGTTYGTYPFAFNGAQVFVSSGDESSWNKPPITLQPAANNPGNPPTPPVAGLSINNVTANPGDPANRFAVFTVTLSGTYTQDVTVIYYSQDGSAIEGVNYLAAYGTLDFAPGVTTLTVSVQILDDHLWGEGAKTFSVNLYQPNGAAIGIGQGTCTIIKNVPPLAFFGSYSGTAGANGWYLSTGIMTLGGNPAGATLTYSLDGGPSQVYTTPFAITAQGLHTVVGTDTDANGSQYIQSFDVNIDSIPPTLATSFAGTRGNQGWYTSAVTAIMTSTDAGSGLIGPSYILDNAPIVDYTGPFTITGDGVHTLDIIVIDYAGNYSFEEDTITIDATPPSVSGAFNGMQGKNGWYTSSGYESLSAADVSGVAALSYRLDGGPARPYAGAFLVNGDGTHTIVATATDLAGNVTIKTFTLKIDVAPPTLTASFSGSLGTSGWFTSGGKDTLTVTPSAAGIASVTYQLDASSSSVYSGPFAISAAGTHTVSATATDNAGRVATQTWTIKIDNVAPTVALNAIAALSTNNKPAFTGLRGSAGNDSTTVTLKIYSGALPVGTPVQVKSVTVAGSAWTLVAVPLSDGTYTVQVEQLDQAGNKGVSAARTFVIKTTTAVAITTWTSPINAGNQTAAAITGTADPGAAIALTISDGVKTIAALTTATAGHWSFAGLNLSALKDGTITFNVKAVDSLGNTATATATSPKTAAAAKLVFSLPPANAGAGALLNAIVIQLTDNAGNPVAQAGVSITLKLLKGTLLGTLTVTTDSHGRATFSTLRIAATGAYQLEARATLSTIATLVDSSLFAIH